MHRFLICAIIHTLFFGGRVIFTNNQIVALNRRGFTLIELILVISILGILAVSALPKFIDITGSARRASRDGVVGAVRSGVQLYRANDMVTGGSSGVYPTTLDVNADASTCSTCFSTVLSTGVPDSSWRRTNSTTYTHNDGTTVVTYAYNATNGTFQ